MHCQGKPNRLDLQQSMLSEAFNIISLPAEMHALVVFNVCSDEHKAVTRRRKLQFCSLTLSCLMELLPFGPLRPCHLPFAMALSFTLRNLRVSLSQTRSMLAYLHSSQPCFITTALAASGATSTIIVHQLGLEAANLIAGKDCRLELELTCFPPRPLLAQCHF